MYIFHFVGIIVLLSVARGQRCRGKFNETINGQCSSTDNCQGTILAVDVCDQGRCCVNETLPSSPAICINDDDFSILYNTSRATFLQAVLNYGIYSAGICQLCQAKAAFLAVAATMTGNFQNDEVVGTDTQFADDDTKYGNTQPGDGSRFRRRGLFGLRGREMYGRLQTLMPQYQSLATPELVALTKNAIDIASLLWRNSDLQGGSNLTQYADGTFYGFSMLWYKLTGDIEQLAEGAKLYSVFLRQLHCGGDLYPGQGPVCQYNTTHNGSCAADCIKGLEDSGEFCGCNGAKGSTCPDSPVHVRCCLGTCSQELKMDLGFVLDASGSIGLPNYRLQLAFTKDLLSRLNVGSNRTHVGIINFSSTYETLTWLNTDYSLTEKLAQVDKAQYFSSGTNTASALRQANTVFTFEHGLRRPEEGATPVIFIITDGQSDDTAATIQVAAVLKNKSITIISVGVGNQLALQELYAICTPPSNENYFAISNYAALEQKINQFTSKSCSEPATVAANTTVTGAVGEAKYKFLKVDIRGLGNKILINAKLLDGNVKLFYSFISRNPKDPEDFDGYNESRIDIRYQVLNMNSISKVSTILKNDKTQSDDINLVIDKSDPGSQFVYVSVKGIEEANIFEVKFDDCANVNCNTNGSSATIKRNVMLLILYTTLFFSYHFFTLDF